MVEAEEKPAEETRSRQRDDEPGRRYLEREHLWHCGIWATDCDGWPVRCGALRAGMSNESKLA